MKSGHADLPLHYGTVPPWLADRMRRLGGAIVQAIVMEYGTAALLQKMSDPFWFQSLGCVLGMDWHSSGITTSVMNALKKAVNPMSQELGIYVCGGRGSQSRLTPKELLLVGDKTGLDANELIRCSRLTAKVDNTAIQDGFQLYLHSFVVARDGEWSVIQQGMNPDEKMARRYHWHSTDVKSFVAEPHSFVYGKNMGQILNLTDRAALPAQNGILQLVSDKLEKLMQEVQLIMPSHHDVRAEDVDLRRLGAAVALAYDNGTRDFESLLLQEGVGPRTLQSLTLVSEVIHGTASRFSDPARFSFAHGGKDGHPFPVPTKVYDETIGQLERAVQLARLGQKEKSEALKNLSVAAEKAEAFFTPNDQFDNYIQRERDMSWQYGGMTVNGPARKPKYKGVQLRLF